MKTFTAVCAAVLLMLSALTVRSFVAAQGIAVYAAADAAAIPMQQAYLVWDAPVGGAAAYGVACKTADGTKIFSPVDTGALTEVAINSALGGVTGQPAAGSYTCDILARNVFGTSGPAVAFPFAVPPPPGAVGNPRIVVK